MSFPSKAGPRDKGSRCCQTGLAPAVAAPEHPSAPVHPVFKAPSMKFLAGVAPVLAFLSQPVAQQAEGYGPLLSIEQHCPCPFQVPARASSSTVPGQHRPSRICRWKNRSTGLPLRNSGSRLKSHPPLPDAHGAASCTQRYHRCLTLESPWINRSQYLASPKPPVSEQQEG